MAEAFWRSKGEGRRAREGGGGSDRTSELRARLICHSAGELILAFLVTIQTLHFSASLAVMNF